MGGGGGGGGELESNPNLILVKHSFAKACGKALDSKTEFFSLLLKSTKTVQKRPLTA